jgi:hypothetical protein
VQAHVPSPPRSGWSSGASSRGRGRQNRRRCGGWSWAAPARRTRSRALTVVAAAPRSGARARRLAVLVGQRLYVLVVHQVLACARRSPASAPQPRVPARLLAAELVTIISGGAWLWDSRWRMGRGCWRNFVLGHKIFYCTLPKPGNGSRVWVLTVGVSLTPVPKLKCIWANPKPVIICLGRLGQCLG